MAEQRHDITTDPAVIAAHEDLLTIMRGWIDACSHAEVGSRLVLNAAIEVAREHHDARWLAATLRRVADAIEAAGRKHVN